MRRITHATLLAAALGLTPLTGFGQSFEAGFEAHNRGDYQVALKHFLPLAEQGDIASQVGMGIMYANGQGVVQNYQEAAAWYRRAAEQGDAGAQYTLGIMYANGEGVPQNDQEAAAWFRRAAQQGDTRAQFNLGIMYANGRGVAQNYREAAAWYRRAAEQGDADAQVNLGAMYSIGQGVSPNPVIAYVLETLATAQGHEMARHSRDLTLRELSSNQVNEGQRLASEWRVGTPLPTSRDVTTWP